MSDQGWLADTRTSYDTVAVAYADQVRDAFAVEPYLRGSLALFADLVRATGGGPVADDAIPAVFGHFRRVPGAVLFAHRRP